MSASVPSSLRRSRLASAAAVLGAALLLAPPPAVADDDDWEDRGRGHRRHYKHKQHKHHDHHEHGDWCAPRRYARPYVAYDTHQHHYAPPRRPRYYCDPCDHWYGTEASFHYHVHSHHRIARALVPAVIAATVFGAIYAGY